MATWFTTVEGTADGVRRMVEQPDRPLVLASRHGLGDNVFCSPCFEKLAAVFGKLYLVSGVNAYATLWHESPLVAPLYIGGVNGSSLQLNSVESFVEQLRRHRVDLGVPEAYVYHYGLFEPHLPYSDERAFVKGRRNFIELFGDGPSAAETPRYHVAPDSASRCCVNAVLDRWLPGRELIAIARYGHTDGGKNFGHDYRDTLEVVKYLNYAHPDRFKFVSFDYTPGEHASEGWAPNLRSVYGFLPCDSAAMHHLLSKARLLITVPSGPMLVGATIPTLKLLTLWKCMPPLHFLDPQFGGENPAHAMVADERYFDLSFTAGWPAASKDALLARWKVRIERIEPETVARQVERMLDS